MKNATLVVILAGSLIALSLPIAANAQVTQGAGNFLASYTGPKNSDLDVKSAQAFYDGTNFRLDATMYGNISSTALYVWGFDRGAGTARLASAGGTGVLFDSVVQIRPDGSVTVNPITGGGTATNFAAGTASINGASFSVTFAASLLPVQGTVTNPSQFTWNLWPRFTGTGGGSQVVSEFLPANSNAPVTNAPEAGTIALLLAAVPMGLVACRRCAK